MSVEASSLNLGRVLEIKRSYHDGKYLALFSTISDTGYLIWICQIKMKVP